MSNGSKNEDPMKSMAVPARKPFARGKIERYFRGVGFAHGIHGQPDLEKDEVDSGSPSVVKVQEVDDFVCDLLRMMSEMGLFVDFDNCTPLPPFHTVDRKGE